MRPQGARISRKYLGGKLRPPNGGYLKLKPAYAYHAAYMALIRFRTASVALRVIPAGEVHPATGSQKSGV